MILFGYASSFHLFTVFRWPPVALFPYNRPAELCVFLLPYGSLFKKSKTSWFRSSDPCVHRLVVILTLIDMVGMGNGPRGRRRRVFSIVTCRVQVYLGTFVLSKKETYTAQEKSAIFFCYLLTFSLILFLHSSYFSLTSTVHRSTSVFFHLCSLVFL